VTCLDEGAPNSPVLALDSSVPLQSGSYLPDLRSSLLGKGVTTRGSFEAIKGPLGSLLKTQVQPTSPYIIVIICFSPSLVYLSSVCRGEIISLRERGSTAESYRKILSALLLCRGGV
jgi:hypothetical protein